VQSVLVPGPTNSYNYTYSTITRNFTLAATGVGNVAGCPSSLPSQTSSVRVVSAITLPNSKQYQFSYDPIYGLLNKVTYPTGATVTYTWGVDPASEEMYLKVPKTVCNYVHSWPVIKKRIVTFDGITPAQEQDFAYTTIWGTGSQADLWITKTTTVTTKDLLRSGQPGFVDTYTYIPLSVDGHTQIP